MNLTEVGDSKVKARHCLEEREIRHRYEGLLDVMEMAARDERKKTHIRNSSMAYHKKMMASLDQRKAKYLRKLKG